MTTASIARTRRDIHTKLRFSKGLIHFLNVGNNSSNVSLVVRVCVQPLNLNADLNFVVPEYINSVTDISAPSQADSDAPRLSLEVS